MEIMITFIKARNWKGAEWLLTLCLTLIFVTVIYFLLHLHYKGTDHKKFDTTQLADIDNVLAVYPDTVPAKLKTDTGVARNTYILSMREKRDQLLFTYFKNEYDNQVSEDRLKQLDNLLVGLGSKDVKSYLTTKELIVDDFFWFTGPLTYLEVLFWALFGVLISLIYYVSIANGQALKVAGDADTGPFDPSEISGQVSKLFYAPVCALVLVLGYNLLSADNKMTDISLGKGLLLFSFICGFFSGRVIKFIDRLKDLVLPIGATTEAADKTDSTDGPKNVSDVTVNLQLAPDISESPDGAAIVDGGFNSAIVTIGPAEGGDIITLTQPAEDQGASFTTKGLPFGKYTLSATMAFKKAETILNLSASQSIEVNDTLESFELALDKTATDG